MILIYICVNLLKYICVMNEFVGGGADPVSIFGRRRYRHQKQGDRHPPPHISPLAATNIHVYTFGSNKIHLNQMHSYVQCPIFITQIVKYATLTDPLKTFPNDGFKSETGH